MQNRRRVHFLGVATALLGRQERWKDFDRDLPPGDRIPRRVDRSAAAPAADGQNLERSICWPVAAPARINGPGNSLPLSSADNKASTSLRIASSSPHAAARNAARSPGVRSAAWWNNSSILCQFCVMRFQAQTKLVCVTFYANVKHGFRRVRRTSQAGRLSLEPRAAESHAASHRPGTRSILAAGATGTSIRPCAVHRPGIPHDAPCAGGLRTGPFARQTRRRLAEALAFRSRWIGRWPHSRSPGPRLCLGTVSQNRRAQSQTRRIAPSAA